MWRGRSSAGPAGERPRGVTLIETLISSALFAFVIVGVYMLHTTMHSTWSRGEMKADLQQNARVGLDRLVQELRMAGYDPQGALAAVNTATAPRTAVRAAGAACLAFVTYNLDRDNTPPTSYSTQVSYYRNADTSVLYRRGEQWDDSIAFTSGSSTKAPPNPVQMATGVHFLSYTYFDAHNVPLVPATTTSTLRCPPAAGASAQAVTLLPPDQLGRVRRIVVTLRTNESRPRIAPEFYTLTTDVRLRNR
jgi:hypothetical protein